MARISAKSGWSTCCPVRAARIKGDHRAALWNVEQWTGSSELFDDMTLLLARGREFP